MLWQDTETNLFMTPQQEKSEMTETICQCWKTFGCQVEKVEEVLIFQLCWRSNLGEIADIEYFRSKLYRSLNVPVSRLESNSGFNLGRASEITRDELKFTKFVQRLRKKFTELFNDILRTQLILKGIINEEDWQSVRDSITYDFLQDGHFAELKNTFNERAITVGK